MTKSSWNKLPLKALFRLDTTSCLPASQPEQAFLHHSIPAWDESGGPVVELGNTIGSNKFLISHACVLVSKLNPRKSRVSVVRDLHGEFRQCASTEFMLYVPIHEDADIEFYSWYMKSECFRSELERVATGTTNSHVRLPPKETLNWKIAHPPLPEQHRIAEILDTIDEAIQKTEALISKLKAMKQGLLQDLLTRGLDKNDKLRDPKAHPEQFKDSTLGRTPKEWQVVSIGKISRVRRGASPRPIDNPVWFAQEGRGWIRISDVTRANGLLKETEQYLSSAGVNKSVSVYPGQIIMSICATIGEPIILDMNACIHDGFVVFDQYDEFMCPEFFIHFLRSKQSYFRSQGQTGTQANLNTNIVKDCFIGLPILTEQKNIAKCLDSHDARIRTEEQYSDKLKLQKKGLMHDLLTGKVRVEV